MFYEGNGVSFINHRLSRMELYRMYGLFVTIIDKVVYQIETYGEPNLSMRGSRTPGQSGVMYMRALCRLNSDSEYTGSFPYFRGTLIEVHGWVLTDLPVHSVLFGQLPLPYHLHTKIRYLSPGISALYEMNRSRLEEDWAEAASCPPQDYSEYSVELMQPGATVQLVYHETDSRWTCIPVCGKIATSDLHSIAESLRRNTPQLNLPGSLFKAYTHFFTLSHVSRRVQEHVLRSLHADDSDPDLAASGPFQLNGTLLPGADQAGQFQAAVHLHGGVEKYHLYYLGSTLNFGGGPLPSDKRVAARIRQFNFYNAEGEILSTPLVLQNNTTRQWNQYHLPTGPFETQDSIPLFFKKAQTPYIPGFSLVNNTTGQRRYILNPTYVRAHALLRPDITTLTPEYIMIYLTLLNDKKAFYDGLALLYGEHGLQGYASQADLITAAKQMRKKMLNTQRHVCSEVYASTNSDGDGDAADASLFPCLFKAIKYFYVHGQGRTRWPRVSDLTYSIMMQDFLWIIRNAVDPLTKPNIAIPMDVLYSYLVLTAPKESPHSVHESMTK
jgi:hypothetical protein